MSSTIKRGFRTFDALNFIDRVDLNTGGSTDHNVYIALSKNTDWPDEDNPPTPVDTIAAETAFWAETIGFQRVSPNDVTMVVPRVNWENGKTYVKHDPANADAYASRFYCINSLFQVFKVEDITQTNPTTITEPIYSAGVKVIDTSDGYKWRFLYELSSSDIANTIQDDWLPVNIGARQTASQKADGDIRAEWTLGAKHVLLRTTITDAGVPLNVSYRQIGLILDPTDSADVRLDATNPDNATVKKNSGTFLYIEHRKKINREAGQTEEPKIIVTF